MAGTRVTSSFFLLAVTLTLLPHNHAAPFQCADLRVAIPACHCEAKIVDKLEDNNHVVINCRNLNMSTLPAMGSSTYVIYEMTLAQNNIQAIPADAFTGLKIQRLDLRQNRLTSIDPNAFRGLEDDLKELYLGAEIGAGIEPPLANLTHLSVLDTLHLEYFKFPNDYLQASHSLHSLINLRSLTLSHSGLTFIQSGTLPTSLTSLTLDYHGFTALPLDVLRGLVGLENLAITHTNVTIITNSAFELNTRLQTLDLGYNRISVLSDGCFRGIETSLQHLSLRNNPISSVANLREVKELTVLTSLQLSEITLSSLPARADFLLNKASLKSLHLEGNLFTTLGPSVFDAVGGSLNELSLARNQLQGMDEQALAGLSALTSLDLSHQTQSQPLNLPTSLASLASLQTLKLSSTRLDQATLWQTVGLLTSLQSLHLDDTSLTTVTDYALTNLTQLSEFNLDRNSLTEVTQEMMAGPRSLAKLMLNSNQIRTVGKCSFYGFSLSPVLELELLGNPLHCDCKLDWLLEEVNASRIKLAEFVKCASPPPKANSLVSRFRPGDFTCITPQTDTPCLELYTTPEPPTTVTTLTPALGLSITNVSMTSISIRWTIAHYPGLTYFRVRLTELETAVTTLSDYIDKRDRSFLIDELKAGTMYSVCINAYNSTATLRTCLTRPTLADDSDQGRLDKGDGSSSNTGIIVGTVIGVLALLAIIAAIIYLVLLRERTSKKELPAQHHTFTASELPGMGAHTKQFTRPKEKQPPKVGRALDENIKVTVISDGHTGTTSPGVRQSVGSYQFLDEKHPNPNPGVAPQGSYAYSNDVDGRPLPTAPEDSMKGYYNSGFQRDTQSESAHVYNQIDQ